MNQANRKEDKKKKQNKYTELTKENMIKKMMWDCKSLRERTERHDGMQVKKKWKQSNDEDCILLKNVCCWCHDSLTDWVRHSQIKEEADKDDKEIAVSLSRVD